MQDRGIELLDGERLDDLQVGGYRLIQRRDCFCLGTDSVLLAHFAAPHRRDRIADLGCGNGAIALLLAAHCADCTVDGVELQAEIADMARRSVEWNGLEARVRIRCGDLRDAPTVLGVGGHYLVVCNPPYGVEGSGPSSVHPAERIARQAGDLSLEELALAASRLLKFGGRFCTVFPAPRALEMLEALRGAKLEPKRICTVHARVEKPPRVVLIEAVKGAGRNLHWLPPLILYDADGAPSARLQEIYGDVQANAAQGT